MPKRLYCDDCGCEVYGTENLNRIGSQWLCDECAEAELRERLDNMDKRELFELFDIESRAAEDFYYND